MSKEPEARYQSIDELDAALAPFDIGEVVPAATLVRPAMRSRERSVAASVANMTAEAHDVRYARSQLLIHGLAAAFAVFVGLWTLAGAVVALVRGAPEETLTSTESALLALTLVLVGATPGYLLVVNRG